MATGGLIIPTAGSGGRVQKAGPYRSSPHGADAVNFNLD